MLIQSDWNFEEILIEVFYSSCLIYLKLFGGKTGKNLVGETGFESRQVGISKKFLGKIFSQPA